MHYLNGSRRFKAWRAWIRLILSFSAMEDMNWKYFTTVHFISEVHAQPEWDNFLYFRQVWRQSAVIQFSSMPCLWQGFQWMLTVQDLKDWYQTSFSISQYGQRILVALPIRLFQIGFLFFNGFLNAKTYCTWTAQLMVNLQLGQCSSKSFFMSEAWFVIWLICLLLSNLNLTFYRYFLIIHF